MLKFEEFTKLEEVLITFGGKAYPKFNQVTIIGGGAGSGKGFQISNLLGIEGKILDVDALKVMAMKSTAFAKKVKEETGVDLANINLRDPANVGKIHNIINDVYNVPDKKQQTLMTSIVSADPRRKPNLIFDVTLKNLMKLEEITRLVQDIGYDKRDIHIVWVINSLDVAIEQNKNRSRVVPDEVLLTTHEGASMTMFKILDMGEKLQKYMDGSIVFTFNQAKVDTDMVKSDKGGSYIKKANYVRVKEVGKKQISPDQLAQEIQDKIKAYTPEIKTW